MPLDPAALLASTGNQQVDTLLCGVIDLVEAVFPGRIRSYHLLGSYSDGSAVQDSDIDLLALFKGRSECEEQEQFRRIAQDCALLSPIRLDLVARAEEQFLTQVPASVKSALLLYGENVLASLPLELIESFLRRSMLGAFHYMMILRCDAGHLTFPLAYPDPDGEFYGYERWGILMTQGLVRGTRTLVNSTTLSATALLALRTGQQVGTKRQSIWGYKQYIGDEWADFLADVYDTCRRQWHYQIPQGMAEREHLRALCAQTLEFENHVLALCREPVLADLHSHDDTSRLLALQRLQYVAYPGEDFMDALRALEVVGSDEIRQSARDVRQTIQGQ